MLPTMFPRYRRHPKRPASARFEGTGPVQYCTAYHSLCSFLDLSTEPGGTCIMVTSNWAGTVS